MGSDHSFTGEAGNVVSPGGRPQKRDIREIYCEDPWFTHIREGRKVVEGRKAGGQWGSVTVKDTLFFRNTANAAEVFFARVIGITHYEGPGALRKYLLGETLARALPGVESLEVGEEIYLTFWTNEEIDEYGMVGIEVEILPNGV
jgi:ASC-1-like (ASCH) protein